MGGRSSKALPVCNVATTTKIGEGADLGGSFDKFRSNYSKHTSGKGCKVYSRDWNTSAFSAMGL